MRNRTVFMLDYVDIIILEMLEKDGRTSFEDMGKKCGISGTSIRKRLAPLFELGYIVNIEAVLSPKAKVEIDILLKQKKKKEEEKRLEEEEDNLKNDTEDDLDAKKFGFSKISS